MMTLEQALETLEKALNVANVKGAFSLQDATIVAQALHMIQKELGPVEIKEPSLPTQKVTTKKEK